MSQEGGTCLLVVEDMCAVKEGGGGSCSVVCKKIGTALLFDRIPTEDLCRDFPRYLFIIL